MYRRKMLKFKGFVLTNWIQNIVDIAKQCRVGPIREMNTVYTFATARTP